MYKNIRKLLGLSFVYCTVFRRILEEGITFCRDTGQSSAISGLINVKTKHINGDSFKPIGSPLSGILLRQTLFTEQVTRLSLKNLPEQKLPAK